MLPVLAAPINEAVAKMTTTAIADHLRVTTGTTMVRTASLGWTGVMDRSDLRIDGGMSDGSAINLIPAQLAICCIPFIDC